MGDEKEETSKGEASMTSFRGGETSAAAAAVSRATSNKFFFFFLKRISRRPPPTPITGNSNEPRRRVRNQRRRALAPADQGPRGEWIWQRLRRGAIAAARLAVSLTAVTEPPSVRRYARRRRRRRRCSDYENYKVTLE